MVDSDILRGYADDSPGLIERFERLRTTDVLQPIIHLLPSSPALFLDVGAGTGRDAAWLAAKGHRVIAVEPVDQLREADMRLHRTNSIRWVNDKLPSLRTMATSFTEFDHILIAGVWQHLRPNDHPQAIAVLADKLTRGGRLSISVRHGPGPATRPCYPAEPDDLIDLARRAGLRLEMRCRARSIQTENRDRGVSWTWLSFERF